MVEMGLGFANDGFGATDAVGEGRRGPRLQLRMWTGLVFRYREQPLVQHKVRSKDEQRLYFRPHLEQQQRL